MIAYDTETTPWILMTLGNTVTIKQGFDAFVVDNTDIIAAMHNHHSRHLHLTTKVFQQNLNHWH